MMRYRVWAIEWYAQLEDAVEIGCAVSIAAAQQVIYHHRQQVASWHYDIRTVAAGGAA